MKWRDTKQSVKHRSHAVSYVCRLKKHLPDEILRIEVPSIAGEPDRWRNFHEEYDKVSPETNAW